MPVSTRALAIITGVLLVAVLVAAVLSWWILRQPPLSPAPIPSVSVG